MFHIKICGITNIDDAQLAVAAGADAIGLNFYAGSPRCVSKEKACEISQALDEQTARVGVFVNAEVAAMREISAAAALHFVQLHGDEPATMLAELAPLDVIKAFRCKDSGLDMVEEFLREANKIGHLPAAVLVDAYEPGSFGGTGKMLDWQAIGQRTKLPGDVPMLLAGGLNSDNIADAIRLARPFGVDVASGVETEPCHKNPALVRRFTINARRTLGLCG